MTNIWLDRHANTLNHLPTISAKKLQTPSTRKQQILCELNNKPLQLEAVPGVYYSASKSLRHDVLRKQQMKQNFHQARQHLEHQFDAKPPMLCKRSDVNNDENLFDYWDVPSLCCMNSCHKTDQQIWSEMNPYDDATFDKLLNCTNNNFDSDYDSDNDADDSIVEFNRSVDMDLSSVNTMMPHMALEDDKDADFLDITPLELPMFSDIDCNSDDDFLL